MSLKDENNIIFVDAKGQVCPYPLITLRRTLKTVIPGTVIEIEVDYEHSANVSIPEWCEKNGMNCETVQLEDRLWRIYVMKPVNENTQQW